MDTLLGLVVSRLISIWSSCKTGLKQTRPAIHFESTETEPQFVAAYKVAIASADALEHLIQTLQMIPIAGGDLASVRHLTIYLATLFDEVHNASTQLAFLEIPRAQYILNMETAFEI